jgi:hypothetical protein
MQWLAQGGTGTKTRIQAFKVSSLGAHIHSLKLMY